LGKIREEFIKAELIEKTESGQQGHHFLWITDFPLFALDPTTGVLETVHHPFTAPHPDDAHLLNDVTDISTATPEQLANLQKIRSLAYDLVLDGQEVGGGSIRIHDAELQKKVLADILKLDYHDLQHLIDALQSGCPPHGGIALGLDRLIAIICHTKSIRDVIAFPKSLDGKDLLSKAPVPITEEEKLRYHLEILDEDREKELKAQLGAHEAIVGEAEEPMDIENGEVTAKAGAN
jgi:aspartyl-tRNA synthetase